MHAIVVENLEKYFPPAYSGWRALFQPVARLTQCALAGISFSVEPGEAVALIGENGAGKSTLLRVLATLILPTRGHAQVSGYNVERDGANARKQLGYYTSADEGFYGRLTGRENLRLFATMNNLMRGQASRRIDELAKLLGFEEILDCQSRTYSTGMLQRLGLARSLLNAPAVLLLDEPTRSLDPLAAAEFRRFLKTEIVARLGTTLLFASHSLDEVHEIANRVVLLSQGRALAFDTPRNLCARTGAVDLQGALERVTGPLSPAPNQ
ncbi:MAG TPA: ABC transporter ATP-binding protein [Candidatus Acidoferrales bacterium]|nr:ABC transporter ATP-binding protein [Candidatus Acidoferrales bacterium]